MDWKIVLGFLGLFSLGFSGVVLLLLSVQCLQSSFKGKRQKTEESFEVQGMCVDCGGDQILLNLIEDGKLRKSVICCPRCRTTLIDIAEFQRPSG